MLGETMALRVIEKINSRLKFLYQKNQILDVPLRRLLCNALIQSQFDYACTVWYLDLSKKLKDKLQVTQNKCIRFCLNMVSTPPIIIGGLNLKICQNFVGAKFFHIFAGG